MDIQLYNRISEKDFERYREKYGEFGCKFAAVNNYIRSARICSSKPYFEYDLGIPRPKTLTNKIKRIFDI